MNDKLQEEVNDFITRLNETAERFVDWFNESLNGK